MKRSFCDFDGIKNVPAENETKAIKLSILLLLENIWTAR